MAYNKKNISASIPAAVNVNLDRSFSPLYGIATYCSDHVPKPLYVDCSDECKTKKSNKKKAYASLDVQFIKKIRSEIPSIYAKGLKYSDDSHVNLKKINNLLDNLHKLLCNYEKDKNTQQIAVYLSTIKNEITLFFWTNSKAQSKSDLDEFIHYINLIEIKIIDPLTTGIESPPITLSIALSDIPDSPRP